jgi:hypothetical protein
MGKENHMHFFIFVLVILFVCFLSSLPFDHLSGQAVAPSLSTTQTSGWSSFTQAPGSLTIYLSSSGNDNNPCTQTQPCKTLTHAKDLIKNNPKPHNSHWVLLKKGDTFSETLGHWDYGGISPLQPLLISSYGTGPRPILNTGLSGGLEQCNAPTVVSNLAIVGIHFKSAYTGSGVQWPPTGINLVCGKKAVNWLFEDDIIENYKFGMVLQGSSGKNNQNIVIRRSQIRNNGDLVPTSTPDAIAGSGMYVIHIDGLVLEENLFYHNGWRDGGIKTKFSHNIYLDNENVTNVTVMKNVIADGANVGIQLRNGGILYNNFFMGNQVPISLGGGDSWTDSKHVHVDVRDNVVLNNINTWGVVFENIEGGIFFHNLLTHNDVAIALYVDAFSSDKGKKVKDLRIANNIIYDSGKPGNDAVLFGGTQSSGSILQRIEFSSNDVQLPHVSPQRLLAHQDSFLGSAVQSSNNRFFAATNENTWFWTGSLLTNLAGWKSFVADRSSVATLVAYPDPNRDTSTYMGSLGYADTSYSNFIAQLKLQSKDTWKPEFTAPVINAYIRAGFWQ